MRIIKEGKIPTFTKKFNCYNCGTIFEADKNEYQNASQIEYIHDGILAYCKCPICKKLAYIYAGGVD